MRSTARKSRKAIRNVALMSSVNDARYWSCDRICAPTSRPYTESVSRARSTTLDHDLARPAGQRDLASGEERDRPPRLQRERAREARTGLPPQIDVDGHLQDRREREQVRERAQPVREERQREDHPREEERDRDGESHHAAVIDEPERRHVVEEPEPEAGDDGE